MGTRVSGSASAVGAGVALALALGARSASAQQLPAPPGAVESGASEATPAAQPTSGCPYSARWSGHCCCNHGYGMRIGVTATSALVIGAAVVMQVLAADRGAEAARLYDARDPNHTMPLVAYNDLAAINGQRQTYQDWAIGLYVAGGVLTAMSALAWIAPLRWRAHTRAYQPQVAVGPTHMSLTFQF